MTKSTLSHAAKSLTAAVVDALRNDILSCRLKPATRLKINDLCERFGVSPGAVREALSRLSAEGLVVGEAQRGFQVSPVSAEELVDLTAVRLEIESLALRRSIAAGDVNWETNLVAAFYRLSRTPERAQGDPERLAEDWAKVHHDFHAALVAGCDSPWLLRLREQLFAQSERYRRLSVPVARQERDLDAEHKALLDAALKRDADAAVTALTQHLSATTRILLEAPEMRAAAEA